jgi:hypothetical protein
VVAEQLPAGWNLPAIVVPNTLTALGQIGNFWRMKFAIPVIGVTGSNGKTTVKEMIASILAAAYGEDGRLATRGNLNNEIGVPLTVMRLLPAHKAAVIELGMNHPGEIARLTTIAAPTVGLVNNAQREHQEFMHTVEAVARENGSVLQALSRSGVAVFPADDEFAPIWPSAVSVFGTTIAGSVQPAGSCSATTAPTPLAASCGRKSWPSKFSPRRATNSWPGASERLSVETPSKATLRVMRAPVTEATSWASEACISSSSSWWRGRQAPARRGRRRKTASCGP